MWMLFCSILTLMTFRWRSIMFLVLFCFISVEISEIQLVCDQPTDGRMDRRTVGHTSYRDARTHLKTVTYSIFMPFFAYFYTVFFLDEDLMYWFNAILHQLWLRFHSWNFEGDWIVWKTDERIKKQGDNFISSYIRQAHKGVLPCIFCHTFWKTQKA